MLFCRSCFWAMVWFWYVFVDFDFFVFVLSNKCYLSKLMLLDFHCQKISFLCKHNFCIDEKHTQWHWDTKVKVFHESISWFMKCPWNCISWMLWKKNFTVYPSLYINKKPCAATLQNCKIFQLYYKNNTEAVICCSVNNSSENLRATMKGFL